jgi:hypothetical protein
MSNSYEENFKKKYLKYKSKYLELKNLLEGGIPLGPSVLPPAVSGFWPTKEQKDKCKKYNGDEKCESISPYCRENKYSIIKNKCTWNEPSISELLEKKK